MEQEQRSRNIIEWTAIVLSAAVMGCAHGHRSEYRTLSAELERLAPPPSASSEESPVALASPDGRLSRAALVTAVLARNPSIEAARQAWAGSMAEYSKSTALADLRADYALAPASIGSSVVRFGQVVRLEQRFPTPGTLKLSGQSALAESEAMRETFEAARLRLAWIASSLFDDYTRITRSLELNDEHRELIEDIKSSAMAQYEAGRVSQQDPLQAEVELAHVIHQQMVFQGELAVVVAEMNGLLHRTPESDLPPPPLREIPVLESPPGTVALQEQAVLNRPELRAATSRVRGAESEVDLAKRDYAPGVGLMGEYNSMWAQTQHQWMVGVSLNIPIQIKPRRGAVAAANAKAGQASAELTSLRDEVRVHAEQTRQRLIEAQHVLRVYQDRLLPAARAQIEAARFGYETGRNSFQALVDAERGLRTLEIQYEQVIATLGQRRADLQHARGVMPGLEQEGETP